MTDPVQSNQWGVTEAFKTLEQVTEGSSAAVGAMSFLRAHIERLSRPAHEREAPHCATCACPPHEAWQPIETAPVQMEPILMTDGKWHAAGHVDHDDVRMFRIYHFAVSQEYDWAPTHWMPLPAGPSQPTGHEQSQTREHV